MPKYRKVAVPYINPLAEQAKSQVEIIPVKFPKELGEEHPFSFELCEKTVKKYGLVHAVVSKHLDFIVSPGFYVKSKEKKAELLINDFIKSGFDQFLRNWVFEALTKGNGFAEIAIPKKQLGKPNIIDLKIINANNMYIERTKNGELVGYNQYIGKFGDKFNDKKVIPFNDEEIIHLPINLIGDCPYGYGIVYPALKTLDNHSMSDRDMHTMLLRKANSPYIANVGSIEEPASQDDVTAIGQKLEYLNNMHEWSFDHRVKISTVDFGNVGEKFLNVSESDLNMLFYIFQVPAVLMGMANVPEGLADSQSQAWERRIQSFQLGIEKVVEEKIFRRILNLNGLDAHVEMIWGIPDAKTIAQRLQQTILLLQNPMISPQLRAMIERDTATSLGFEDEDIKLLPKPELDMELEKKEEEKLKQPEIPGEKPNAREIAESVEGYTMKEWLNFDYETYKSLVIRAIRNDEFADLAGSNELDFQLGKLTPRQIEKLRSVLENNFRNNGTIRNITEQLKKIGLKNRYIMQNGKRVLQFSRAERPLIIARTESTRMGALGVLENYKLQGIENVRFLASISDRTCPKCESLNGQIINIREAQTIIPVHTGCRCSWIAVE